MSNSLACVILQKFKQTGWLAKFLEVELRVKDLGICDFDMYFKTAHPSPTRLY